MNNSIKLIIKKESRVDDNETDDTTWFSHSDGLLIDPSTEESTSIDELKCLNILNDGNPKRDTHWKEDKNCLWVCSKGIEQISRYRDEWPELNWVPRLNVYKPQMSYRFSGRAIGEGFSFYIPDTAMIKEWAVTDQNMTLREAISKVKKLGFSSLWLHSLDAESRGKGLELEMLDKTQDSQMDIWISGGITDIKHLSNLSKCGGVSSVIIDESFIREIGIEPVLLALAPKVKEETITRVDFDCGRNQKVV